MKTEIPYPNILVFLDIFWFQFIFSRLLMNCHRETVLYMISIFAITSSSLRSPPPPPLVHHHYVQLQNEKYDWNELNRYVNGNVLCCNCQKVRKFSCPPSDDNPVNCGHIPSFQQPQVPLPYPGASTKIWNWNLKKEKHEHRCIMLDDATRSYIKTYFIMCCRLSFRKKHKT